MEERNLVITTIGKKIDEESSEDGEVFVYQNNRYEKLLIWDQFHRLLDLRKTSSLGFHLKSTIVDDKEYLALIYSERNGSSLTVMDKLQQKFFISSFFNPVDQDHQEEHDQTSNTKAMPTLDIFYERLKEIHEKDNFDSMPQNVQHPSLKSTTRLRPYQMKGIKWMLKRELEAEELPSSFVAMQLKTNGDKIMYYNRSTHEFTRHKPESLNYPSGGILCDEMGLGKTVEMITLILMNPRLQIHPIKCEVKMNFEDIPLKQVKALSPTKKTIIKCICHNKKKLSESPDDLIVCSQCHFAQHKQCVRAEEIDDIYSYICPICWKSTNRIIDSSTTIIVSPTSIRGQWYSEILRHVDDDSFKVLVYDGISSGWISPEQIAKYDIIVTDFNTLSKELYFAESIDRELRNSKKYEYPPSPLIHVKFWRVVLDEAQMVENANARPSQMVHTLPAVHRWGCTGTPIERGSIQNLYGLIYFLDIHPYTNFKTFNELWIDYRNGKPDKLILFLSKIMWRTCKKDVEHEIEIPPQREIIHYVQMSDLQECYYRQAHNATKPKFLNFILNYISYYDREKKRKVANTALKEKALYELDNATLKTLLDPLRMLRQDCTIANRFTNVTDQTRVKQTLHADQLHEHLVKKTTIECKSALRTICSSFNGMAGLKMAQEKYDEAVLIYKNVLRLAKDFCAVNGVHVDSMLQIHSYNSLLELAVITQKDIENKEQYTREMMALEWKYIRNYYDKVQSINEEILECEDELKKARHDYSDRDGFWWREIISVSRSSEEEKRFLELINAEFFRGAPGVFTEQIRSMHGIELMLTEWSDKVERCSKEVKKRFKKFDFVIHDLKSSHELTDEANEKIRILATAALDCHLNLFEENKDTPAELVPKNPAKLCDLCKLNNKLNEYECILFNKTLVNDAVEGTWNPRLEERIIKVIFSYAKRLHYDQEEIDMGKHFFKYLEALKKNYKMHAQLWVETNYTIAAYDELKMCKTRLQIVDSVDDITEEDANSRLKVARYEIDDQFGILNAQKLEAEMQFTRLNGRLKYLNHLKDKNETPTCPICTNLPTNRYFVTVCGHSFCAECFLLLTREKRRFSNYDKMKINCPVCRTSQEIGNIMGVTCNEQIANAEPIVGSYSPKIDEIIRCILRLRTDDSDVKILIFSQWDSILSAIMPALKNNSITYRVSFGKAFSKEIGEFKDPNHGVTCMMLSLKYAGKGLNLTEATHVFFVEPILNADEEMQAVGRVHRIGQTRETFIHKFISRGTIEESLYDKIIQEKDKWIHKQFTIRDLENLFGQHEPNNFMEF